MKMITLKLTKEEFWTMIRSNFNEEWDGIKRLSESHIGGGYTMDIKNKSKCTKYLKKQMSKCFPTTKLKNGLEFSQMLSAPNGRFYEGSESQKRDNLESILSKLDEVK